MKKVKVDQGPVEVYSRQLKDITDLTILLAVIQIVTLLIILFK